MSNLLQTISDIKALKIQGATNVAKESIRALGEYSKDSGWNHKELKKNALLLMSARPTEPLTRNALFEFLNRARGTKEGESLVSLSLDIINSLKDAKEKIIHNGVSLIKDKMAVLTHCHSSTVTGILKEAKENGVLFKVYLTETRPRQQGYITAEELVNAGIDATMITDSEASFLVSKEDNIDISLILLGADAILSDGSAINKVGSYGISLSAKRARIPLYVTATLLKYSVGDIPIEERKGDEIWDNAPSKLKILNPAFDKIPSENIHSFITEYGLIKPKDIRLAVKKHYPFVFESKQ